MSGGRIVRLVCFLFVLKSVFSCISIASPPHLHHHDFHGHYHHKYPYSTNFPNVMITSQPPVISTAPTPSKSSPTTRKMMSSTTEMTSSTTEMTSTTAEMTSTTSKMTSTTSEMTSTIAEMTSTTSAMGTTTPDCIEKTKCEVGGLECGSGTCDPSYTNRNRTRGGCRCKCIKNTPCSVHGNCGPGGTCSPFCRGVDGSLQMCGTRGTNNCGMGQTCMAGVCIGGGLVGPDGVTLTAVPCSAETVQVCHGFGAKRCMTNATNSRPVCIRDKNANSVGVTLDGINPICRRGLKTPHFPACISVRNKVIDCNTSNTCATNTTCGICSCKDS